MTTNGEPDGLDRWRAEHAEQEARFAKERAEERSREKRHEHGEIKTLRNEIAMLRAEADTRAEINTEAVGAVVAELQKEIRDHIDTVLKTIDIRYRDLERELFRTLERRYAQLAGRLDALGAPDSRARAKEYRFANERETGDEITDLPNPILPRAVN